MRKIKNLAPNKEYVKENKLLETICEECGRKGKIPFSHCNECWMEMRQTMILNKKK